MESNFYIPRRLTNNSEEYTEESVLEASDYIVVLAEPGGGKTELMGSLAQKLGVAAVTANVFRHMGAGRENCPLVIDAFDELAKIDQSGIHVLLANAKRVSPTRVIISSRSSEWDNAATSAFKDFLGHHPLIVRLYEFDREEQRRIFEHHVEGEDFAKFQEEIERFDLAALLPNPQFLKLFADAYIESGRFFTDKRSIFSLAVERLAKEANANAVMSKQAMSVANKIEVASEVFAKLLLSGAEGVGTSEATEDRMYPLLSSLLRDNDAGERVLATRLFKPGDRVDQHRSVHKIVTEYCAANYLTKRITDPADPLTLSRCIPVIAPNSTVRDELRGLVGWMAALGNKSIEEAIIKLDPYSVLANGDASQLAPSSKRLLIRRLKETEAKDPYFRRGDYWRRFSIAGILTADVVDEIKPLLSLSGAGHLRDLILEIMVGSQAGVELRKELRQLVLSREESGGARLLAGRCLLGIEGYDYHADLVALIAEESQASLRVAADYVETLGAQRINSDCLSSLFHACANLYPAHSDYVGTSRYFVKSLIGVLPLPIIEVLLDDLAKDLACKCGRQNYECDCRNGISKIIGSMLDRYFELAGPPYDPARVWSWVGNLNYHEQKSASQSKSVEVLQKDDSLRQGIIALVFGGLTDRDQIVEIKHNKFDWHTHSGLYFREDDYRFVVDMAFEAENLNLWASFIAAHRYYRNKEESASNSLRRHMRKQALENQLFMQEWVRSNRASENFWRHNGTSRLRRTRRMKRRLRKQAEIRSANITYVKSNRDLVESGRHWGCLVRFAELVLISPDKIEHEFGEEALVRNALRNCLDFLTPYVPDLPKLAELQCASQYQHSETILYAACVEIFRAFGSLESVDRQLLRSLRTNIAMGYSAISSSERDALMAEVDRLIFPDAVSAHNFLKEYLEPQLACPDCKHPELWLLRSDDAFSGFRASLSVQWLDRYPEIALDSLDTLFDIAVQYGDRDELNRIISSRCDELMSRASCDDARQAHMFWLIRAFYFMDNIPEPYWDWIRSDKDSIFLFQARSGRLGRSENSNWPTLTSAKIGKILEAFVDQWPKVVLPDHWGTDSPKDETAYRFLTDVIWSIGSDGPDDAIPIISQLLSDTRFTVFHLELKSIYAGMIRRRALRDFEPPAPSEIVDLLDRDSVVTVEGLRQLVVQELQDYQGAIDGGEFNSADRFYMEGKRLDEESCTQIIAERLSLRLLPLNITVTVEHQLKSANRSDFTVAKLIGGKRRLLVAEVKGQWNRELYTAASVQLYERYSNHPDAEQQGIFLAIWYGADEKVAGRKRHGIGSAQELKLRIESTLPAELAGLIDVFVLDVSRHQ